MTIKTDNRQTRQRAALDQISNNTNLRLDTILNLINDELKMPLRISQSNPDSLTITVGALKIQTTDVSVPPTIPTTEGHQRQRTLPSVETSDVLFAGGSVVFPAVNGGTITTSAGSWTLVLNCPSGQYVKVLTYYVDGNLRFVQGTANVDKDLATLPLVPSTITTGGVFVAGYVTVHNTGGVIDNISGDDIYQYTGGNPLVQDASTTVKGQINLTAQSFSGLKSFVSGIAVDTISENTLNTGVTIDGVLIKDGFISAACLPKGGEPPQVVSSTSGTAGTADSVSRSDHSHDLGIHSHIDNDSGGVVVPASPTQQGAVTTTSQSFAGVKTFNDNMFIGDSSGRTLTINGITVTIPNGLNFDSNTFVIDSANNRIGINIASPTVALDVVGDAKISGDIAANGGDLTTTSATATLFNTNATTLNIGGVAETLNISNNVTNTSIFSIASGVTSIGNTKTVNVGLNGASGSTTNINFGSSVSGSVTNYVFNGNKAILAPVGDTASRPTGTNGMFRYNTDISVFEHYTGSSWKSIASENYATAEAIKYSIVFG